MACEEAYERMMKLQKEMYELLEEETDLRDALDSTLKRHIKVARDHFEAGRQYIRLNRKHEG